MDKNLSFGCLAREEWKPSTYFENDPYQLTEFKKILGRMVVRKPPPVKERWRRTEQRDEDETFTQQDYLEDVDDTEWYVPVQPEPTRTQCPAKAVYTRQKRRNGKDWVFKVDSDENTEPESEPEPDSLRQNDPKEPCSTELKHPAKVAKGKIVRDAQLSPRKDKKEEEELEMHTTTGTKKVPNIWQQGSPWNRTAHRGGEEPKPEKESESEPDPHKNWYKETDAETSATSCLVQQGRQMKNTTF
ncbi:hypothetical protein JOB18_013512 [Solea senegalensis]|uniref:Uncharacterized protein n=1 Tax=Solea senegalensis TaxID=28829 RepID=A0AAV6S1A9_SOLSE|nr:hypothetical protein JOB18_013512 [Solea senegalensis]